MYTQSHLSPEAQARPKAIFYTTLLAALIAVSLFIARITISPAARAVIRPVIDSLQVAYIPLELARRPQLTETISRLTGRSAAPVANWKPTHQEAKPNAAPLPGNIKPVITSMEPSPVESPKIDERGLYRKTEKSGNGQNPQATSTDGGSPKGQPGGDTAGPGGTGGIGLDLSGFRFGRLSVAQDPYDENGRIVFQIRVDAEGHILSMSVVETTVSANIIDWYRTQLLRVRLIPTSSGDRPSISTGRISLKITSR